MVIISAFQETEIAEANSLLRHIQNPATEMIVATWPSGKDDGRGRGKKTKKSADLQNARPAAIAHR
jgi:hypothetical protein